MVCSRDEWGQLQFPRILLNDEANLTFLFYSVLLCSVIIILWVNKENKLFVSFYNLYLETAIFESITVLIPYYCVSQTSRVLLG